MDQGTRAKEEKADGIFFDRVCPGGVVYDFAGACGEQQYAHEQLLFFKISVYGICPHTSVRLYFEIQDLSACLFVSYGTDCSWNHDCFVVWALGWIFLWPDSDYGGDEAWDCGNPSLRHEYVSTVSDLFSGVSLRALAHL